MRLAIVKNQWPTIRDRQTPGNIQNGGRKVEVTDQENESKLRKGGGGWGRVTRSQKYGCQKTRSSESEHRTRDPLGKPMMIDGANPCAPMGAVGAIRGTRLLTRYRSEETLTRMRSSPTRTFSPSDLCFEAGCIVHQHASPKSGVTVRTMVSHNALHQGTHNLQAF